MRSLDEPRYGFEDATARGEEEAPVLFCPVCGSPIYDGDRYVTGHGTDCILGCEHCSDTHIA